MTENQTKELQEIQLHIFNMMELLDTFFKSQGIYYILLGGTILGAVRHKGFIPWDDDADIGVLYKDFAKIETLLKEKFATGDYIYDPCENQIVDHCPRGVLRYVGKRGGGANTISITVLH